SKISVLTNNKTKVILIKDKKENTQAYIIYKLNNKRLEVIEIAYSSQAYKESMYHFMMKHQATIQEVSLPTYENDLLSYIINDPTFVQKKHPYFMARIVHLEQFLKNYPFNYSIDSSINLF